MNLIINPAAGRGRGEKVSSLIFRHLEKIGLDFHHALSEGPGHIIDLAREGWQKGHDLIVACGGDGTFHEVINGLDGQPVKVGLIPCGTGNDLAANFGIPTDIQGACRVLKDGIVRKLDLVQVGKRVYAGIAGAGFDSMVNRLANQKVRFLRGTPVYVYSVLRTLSAFKPIEMFIEADNFQYQGNVMFVVVANTARYGGGMKIAPTARADDGLLELIIIKEISKIGLIRAFPKVFSGSHMDHPALIHHRTTKVRLTASKPVELFGDGEFIQDLPVAIEIIPKALSVIVPRKETTDIFQTGRETVPG